MVAHNPLHGSGHAAFPHPALALGNDAKSHQGIGMIQSHSWQPALLKALKSLGGHSALVAAPPKRSLPQPSYLITERVQRLPVHGHPVVMQMSQDHRTQPVSYFRYGIMQALTKLGFDFIKLSLHPLSHRLPNDREPTLVGSRADMGEPEKVESLWFSFTPILAVLGRMTAKLDQTGLLQVKFQS